MMSSVRSVLLAAVLAGPACLVQTGCAESSPGRLQTCRPRLFFRDKEWKGGLSLAQLRQRATTQPFADRVRLLRTTRANLALKWLMTGDESAAAEALAGLTSFNLKLDTSNEGTELIDVALAYDWLFAWPGFTAEDKRQVAERMVALADQMRSHLLGEGAHVFHTRMYAWTAGVGVAGLAVHDVHPAGARLFRFACDYYEQRLLPARRIQGGAIHNGLSYGPNYMMFPLLQFLAAARSAAGIDYFHTSDPARSDWLREMAFFLIQCVQPDMRHVRYADVSTVDPAKHFRFMLDIFAAEYDNGYAAELANRISERFKTSGYHAEWIYLFFAFHNPKVAPEPLDRLPTFRVFSPDGVGHVFARSDWSAGATLIQFRCGDYFENHGHFDQGSFTIFKRGDLALKGGGYWGFDTPHRHHYYKQAISTNTVVFSDPDDPADEGRQRNFNYQQAGTVEDYLAHKSPTTQPCLETGGIVSVDDRRWATCTSGDFHCVAADVTSAWDRAKVRRFVRHLAFVDGRHLVVVDETETTRPAVRARWLLHTQVEPKQEQGAWTVRLKDSVLFVQPLVPAEPKVTLIGGPGRECEVNGINYPYITTEKYLKYRKNREDIRPEPEAGLWRMEVEHAKPAARRLFVTVLTAEEAGGKLPSVAAAWRAGRLVVQVGQTAVSFARLVHPAEGLASP